MDKDYLFEEGNKEIEILEFRAGGYHYGLVISDVREILPYDTKPTRIPNAHPYMDGIVMPRDFIIPIIDTAKCLKLEVTEKAVNQLIVVTSISDLNIAFLVDDVVGMHRTTTEYITKPGRKLSTSVKGSVIAILNMNGNKIEILEPIKIFKDINPDIILA